MSDPEDQFWQDAGIGTFGTCALCGAEIVWMRTSSGRRMPCDPRIRKVLSADGEVHCGRESHFSTCPHAAKARKTGGTNEA